MILLLRPDVVLLLYGIEDSSLRTDLIKCIRFASIGMIAAAIFYGFVLIVKGSESIPYMLEDPDYEKVYMNSFEYTPKEYERIRRWICEYLIKQDIEDKNIEEAEKLFLSLCKKTEEKNVKSKVLGECVLRFIDEPEIIIKDNGALFKSDIEDERLSYNILMSCNCNTIHLMAPMQQKILMQ